MWLKLQRKRRKNGIITKPSTRFKVDDNSGAKEAEIVGFQGILEGRQIKVGDIIKITVKKALLNGNIKPGQMFYAVITRTRQKNYAELMEHKCALIIMA